MGRGKKLLLAMHGYGNDASMYNCMEALLGDEYTIVSLDMPYHGGSKWPDRRVWTIAELKTLVKLLLEQYEVEQLSLMGYSMGGRVCLKIAEIMPECVEHVVLLASDGLTFNSFYYFVTNTTLGKGIFESFLRSPQKYMSVVNFARRRNWLDESRYKFASRYLDTEDSRKFLNNVWPAMRHILPDYNRLSEAITEYSIPIFIFMGKHDRVIPVKLAHKFNTRISTAQVHVLDKGHRVLDDETLPQICNCLLT
jgi:pimeloyl-ACP methyl ester carboxylesterase